MDPETAVFWPLDPAWTLAFHVGNPRALSRTHAVAWTFENLINIFCSDRFSKISL